MRTLEYYEGYNDAMNSGSVVIRRPVSQYNKGWNAGVIARENKEAEITLLDFM